MNRRTFIKLTGLTLLSPTLFAGKEKLKWISINDEIPKLHQRIIIFYRCYDKEEWMSISKVVKVKSQSCVVAEEEAYFPLDDEYPITHIREKGINREELIKEINQYIKVDENLVSYIESSLEIDQNEAYDPFNKMYGCYWIPIDKAPRTLPRFPYSVGE